MQILNVFPGGGNTWVEFKYVDLGYVGGRRLLGDTRTNHPQQQPVIGLTSSAGRSAVAKMFVAIGPGLIEHLPHEFA